jgi:hypothetical protein
MVLVRISRDSLTERQFEDCQIIHQQEAAGDKGLQELADIIAATAVTDENNSLSA